MEKLIDRLPMILEEAMEDLPVLRQGASDPSKDRLGSFSNTLSNTLRFIGVAEYVVNSDVSKFKASLGESARIRLALIRRYNAGDSISSSYVSMLSYKQVFNALASGDFNLSKELASSIGGRFEVEAENDTPFDVALGYLLKAFVLGLDDADERLSFFGDVVSKPVNEDFMGYKNAFSAIKDGASQSFSDALESVVVGHRRQCKGTGVFRGLEDEVLCVWGVGMANLAKLRGLSVHFDNPLIPAVLL